MSEMQHMTSQLIPSDFDVNALDVVSEVLCPSRVRLYVALASSFQLQQVTRASGDECSQLLSSGTLSRNNDPVHT